MNQFVIRHPPGYSPERKYAVGIALRNYLGLPHMLIEEIRKDISISIEGDGASKSLTLPDILFQVPPANWLRTNSVPQEPLLSWTIPPNLVTPAIAHPQLPILYGKARNGKLYWENEDSQDYLGIDVFGSLFFMLARYEEMVCQTRDAHDRFPASASLAFREGFLERPIVNEYLELLWRAIKNLWPQIDRKPPGPARLLVTHDVDYPTCTQSMSTLQVVKNCVGDVVNRHDATTAAQRFSAHAIGGKLRWKLDPGNTFDFLMNCSENVGLRSEFYFIPEASAGKIDGNYDLESLEMRQLLRTIHTRGHRIGYHGSYLTCCDAARTKYETDKLKRIAQEEQIEQDLWNGRQHFLRWQAPATWQNWQDAKLNSDSSVGFADRVGFRCGYCHEYPVFNLRTRRQLSLLERPLVAMDQTLSHYMGLAWPDIVEKLLSLSQTCHLYGGDFTLLWHNSSLLTKQSKQWYREILRNLSTPLASSTAA